MTNRLCICMFMHKCGMWACHSQKIKWTCSMGLCFLSSFFQRARKSKWFQQMGLGLIRPSVSEVQENEKLAETVLCKASLCLYVKPKIYRSDVGSHLLSYTSSIHTEIISITKTQTTSWCPLSSTVLWNHVSNLSSHQRIGKFFSRITFWDCFHHCLSYLRFQELHLLLWLILQDEHTPHNNFHSMLAGRRL